MRIQRTGNGYVLICECDGKYVKVFKRVEDVFRWLEEIGVDVKQNIEYELEW